MRYKPVGHLHDCAQCTQAAVTACPDVRCTTDHRVLVIDRDVHDRWHNEQNAHTDPRQAAMF